MLITNVETVKWDGHTWKAYSRWTDEDGTEFVNVSRICTGHWHGGAWITSRHLDSVDIPADKYNALPKGADKRDAGY